MNFPKLGYKVRPAGAHKSDFLFDGKLAGEDPDVAYYAAIIVVDTVEDKRRRRLIASVGWRRKQCDDRVQKLADADACLCADAETVLLFDAQDVLDFLGGDFRLGRRQVNLVDYADKLRPDRRGQIRVGHGLGLNALAGVDDEKRPLAGRKGPRDLVMKIHVARRIDQVQHIVFAVVLVVHRYSRGLYCDAALPLDVHIVEQLVFFLTVAHRAGNLHYAVGQRALAVVDMRYYRKISY